MSTPSPLGLDFDLQDLEIQEYVVLFGQAGEPAADPTNSGTLNEQGEGAGVDIGEVGIQVAPSGNLEEVSTATSSKARTGAFRYKPYVRSSRRGQSTAIAESTSSISNISTVCVDVPGLTVESAQEWNRRIKRTASCLRMALYEAVYMETEGYERKDIVDFYKTVAYSTREILDESALLSVKGQHNFTARLTNVILRQLFVPYEWFTRIDRVLKFVQNELAHSLFYETGNNDQVNFFYAFIDNKLCDLLRNIYNSKTHQQQEHIQLYKYYGHRLKNSNKLPILLPTDIKSV